MGFEPGHEKYGGVKKGYKKAYSREAVEAAFEKAKIKHGGVSLLEHLCELAYEDKTIAVAMIRKLVPDLRSLQIEANPLTEEDYAIKQAETLSMMERSTNGSLQLMEQVRDLLGRIKVGMNIDEGFVAEIEKLLKPLEGYCDNKLVFPWRQNSPSPDAGNPASVVG